MEAKIVTYLEEYARELRTELDALMDRSLNDGDNRAGDEALEIGLKIRDIKGIIKRWTHQRESVCKVSVRHSKHPYSI